MIVLSENHMNYLRNN